ncbi:ABC transporter ATP-binding protein [Dickeya fangzhongdai]
MKDGDVVERGTVEQIFNQPQHPYTRQLLSTVAPVAISRQNNDSRPPSHALPPT